MTSFKKLGLSEPVLKAIKDLGFEKPSEIQEQSIPQLLIGEQDFIGLAQTGTGKTAAFGLPLLERIDPNNNKTQALILAPTRELGKQIAEQLALYSKYLQKVNVLPVYGGAAISGQIKDLRKPQHVIIATPGRLIDLIKRKVVKLDSLRYLILDEADEMLNMGFKEDIDKILSYAPQKKLTWLFSATMPPEIKRIVSKYMKNPSEVKVNSKNEVNSDIEHKFTLVDQSDKTKALMRFLDIYPNMRGLVFCRTKRNTQKLAEELYKRNYKADSLHGDLSQSQRDRVMKRFKNHELHILVATDVAARGIDVNDLTHVFHFTLPDDVPYYTHRSGRTARAGKKGTSIAFINNREGNRISQLSKKLDISFEKIQIPDGSDITEKRIQKWCETILEKQPKKVDEKILAKALTNFGNLTKEELLAKLISMELEKVSAGTTDLNKEALKPGKKGKGRGGKHFGSRGPKNRGPHRNGKKSSHHKRKRRKRL